MFRLFWFFKRLARCFISDLIFFPTVIRGPAYKLPCTRHSDVLEFQLFSFNSSVLTGAR